MTDDQASRQRPAQALRRRAVRFLQAALRRQGAAPALAALYVMVSHEIADHSTAEAFGWLNSGALVGGALGTAIGGVVADSYSPFAVVMVSAALALAAASTPLIARTAGPVSGLSREPEPAACEV